MVGIQAADVQAFIPELLSNLHIETLIHGNATKEDALKLTRIVEENLGAKPLDFEKLVGVCSLMLPSGIFRRICIVDFFSYKNHCRKNGSERRECQFGD